MQKMKSKRDNQMILKKYNMIDTKDETMNMVLESNKFISVSNKLTRLSKENCLYKCVKSLSI